MLSSPSPDGHTRLPPPCPQHRQAGSTFESQQVPEGKEASLDATKGIGTMMSPLGGTQGPEGILVSAVTMKRLPGQVKKGEFKSYGSSLVPKCFVRYSQISVAGVQANTQTHTSAYMCMHTQIDTYMHTYTCTHTYIHIST